MPEQVVREGRWARRLVGLGRWVGSLPIFADLDSRMREAEGRLKLDRPLEQGSSGVGSDWRWRKWYDVR